MIRREPAGRHDAVDVRMADQGLPPRVEDAQDADLRAEMARIGRDLAQRRRTGAGRARCTGARHCDRRAEQRMREREDDVDIRHVEQLALPRVPASARAPAPGTSGSAGCDTSYRRWPDVRRRHTDRDARRARRSDTARCARRTVRCCTLSHGCCSRKVSPCAWRTSATSTAGRLTTCGGFRKQA